MVDSALFQCENQSAAVYKLAFRQPYTKYILRNSVVRGGPSAFEGEGGGWKNWFVQEFFSLTGQCFYFTVKALQEFFFSNLPPPPPPPKKSQMVRPKVHSVYYEITFKASVWNDFYELPSVMFRI